LKSIVTGSTLRGLESAFLLAEKGCDTTILCSGTYLGEDITGTWKWYPRERQDQLRSELDRIAVKYDLPLTPPGLLYPGTIKRLLAEWVRKAGIKVCYMTRLFGAVVKGNVLTGIAAADKQGLFFLPCSLVVDATMHHEATRVISHNPLRFPKDHPITMRLELREVTCDFSNKLDLKDVNAILLKGIRDERQAYLEFRRQLPYDMSMQEARAWAVSESCTMLSALKQFPETSDAIPGEALPYAIDLDEMPVNIEENIKGWYLTCLEKWDTDDINTLSAESQLLINGNYLPFSLNDEQEILFDWKLLPHTETEVLVAGAGTAGIWAAISAARAGAQVCAVELLPYPGGTRSMGGVNHLYYGNRNRLFMNMWREIKEFTNDVMGRKIPGMLHAAEIMFYFSEIARCNIQYLSNAIACGARKNDRNELTDVLFCGEDGPFVVRAQRSIDATGDGDIAVYAGCGFDYGDDEMHVMQNYSQWNRCTPERNGYRSIDQDTMDQTRRSERTRAIEWNQVSLADYDMFDMLTVRESRRIHGKSVVTFEDAVRGKRTPDIIYETYCTYDPHGRCMNIYGRLGLMPVQGNPMFIAIPLGSILPKDVNNLVVVGKAISADQDTFNYIRMNADVMSIGWIAGRLCVQSIRKGMPVDALPLDKLQEQLYDLGAITLPPPDTTTYSTSPDRIAAEILAGEESGFRNAVITNWEEIRDLVRNAYDLKCYRHAELLEKTLLWFGDAVGAQHLTEVLSKANQRFRKTSYKDRQMIDGFIKCGIVGELDDYWLINQLVILLSKAHIKDAVPVIYNVMCNTTPGSGWQNNSSQYVSVRLDCQSAANYDRILCLAEAAVLMPDSIYASELTRLYKEIEVQEAPPATFYKEYLQVRLLAAMKACGAKETEQLLKFMCSSRYSSISSYAKKLLVSE